MAVLFPRVALADNPSSEEFRHDAWNRVLEQFVDENGRVDYQALNADRTDLDSYVSMVNRVSPESHPQQFPDRDAELAYYLNAYNALVFHSVLARGPETKSVWRGGLISGLNFFVRNKVVVGGRKTNLRNLENDIIRDRYRDPRIHAALNCASISCPRLPREAFLPATLEAQLDAAIREFVNTPAHVVEDAGVIRISAIFDWFEDDFIEFEERQGVEDPNLLDYVNRYRDVERRFDRNATLRFLDYDKGINSQ